MMGRVYHKDIIFSYVWLALSLLSPITASYFLIIFFTFFFLLLVSSGALEKRNRVSDVSISVVL